MRTLTLLVVLPAVLLLAAGPLGAQETKSSSPGTGSATTEINGKTLQGWIKEMKDPDPGVRERAVKVITFFDPDVAAREAGPTMIDLLIDPDASVRVNVLLAMASTGVTDANMSKAVTELAKRLEDPQGIVRYHAAMMLSTLDKDARPAIPALVNRAKDPASYEIRKAVVFALGRAGAADDKTPLDMRAANALLPIFQQGGLADKSVEVRVAAVKAFGAMGFPEKEVDRKAILTALRSAIAYDKEKAVVIWAHVGVMALDEVNDKDLDAIAKHLKGKDFQAKFEALRALGAMGTKAKARAADVFEQLGDKEPVIQATAAWALGEMGDAASKAEPTLKEMLAKKDTDERVKEAIKDALQKINGKPKK